MPEEYPSISLCMIVKNEEDCLARCLNSVCQAVDEIIIVDTGSADRTVEIARRYTDSIFFHPWENDFSKHRNQSLSYATGDWILQLDADEELFEADRRQLRRTIRQGTADYYFCQFHDVDRNGDIKGVCNLIRLFRNKMGMTFTQKVHNQLQVRGNGDYSKIRVKHYGYDLSSEKMAQKHIRTTTLLKEMLQADPEQAYCHYQLSNSYSMNREYEKAIEHGEMALDIRRRKKLKNSFFYNAYYPIAQAYYALGEYQSAERVCLEALDSFDMHLDACAMLSTIYFKQQSTGQCRSISLRYLDIYKRLDGDPALIGNGCSYCYNTGKRSDVFMGLGCIHFFEKDYAASDAYFMKAYADSMNKMEVSENLFRFYLKQHMDEKAIQWLSAAYEAGAGTGRFPEPLQERPHLYLKIGNRYLVQGDTDAAGKCLEHVDDSRLSHDEKLELRLLQIRVFWSHGAVDDLVRKLESMMTILNLDTNRHLHSLDDLGRLLYDVVEGLCEQRQWHLAEQGLALALQVAPSAFNPEKLQQLLAGAEQ